MADENKKDKVGLSELTSKSEEAKEGTKESSEEKYQPITLEELIYTATKITRNKLTPEEIDKFGERMIIRAYLPILDKMRAVMSSIFEMNCEEVEMEEIRVTKLRKYMFFNVLLSQYAMIDVSNKQLQTYEAYDLLYPIFAPFILGYCAPDYKEIKNMIQESLNIYAMKDLTSLFENVDYQSLEKAAQENEKLIQRMAEDKEALKEIRELHEALVQDKNTEKAQAAVNKITQLNALRKIADREKEEQESKDKSKK